jgi:formylmethanofuran dehydrogenase subunit C
MPLALELITPIAIPLEVDSIRLEYVRQQSAGEVEHTLVQCGNRRSPIGEFCKVSGSAAEDETIVWLGDCSKVKLIGSHLNGGRVIVEGSAGMHLGAEMRNGEIVVSGDAGDWVGAEMKGGRIHIHGHAGNLVGAAYRGGRWGMTGGEILVDGNAGNEVGHSMRRGLIAVGGDIGDFAGVSMIAGTIIACGQPGLRAGSGMKRGTIALLGRQPVEILPTFKSGGKLQTPMLRMLLRHLRSLGFPLAEELQDPVVQRYWGDLLELGKGELLVLCQ